MLWRLFFGGYFAIQSITCIRDVGECDEELEAELKRLKGDSLLTFRADPMIKKLKQADPTIDQLTINVSLPNKLLVRIRTRRPEVILKTTQSSKALIADTQGLVFAVAEPQDFRLPTVVTENLSGVTVGDQIADPSILAAIKLAKTFREHYLQFQEIQIDGNNIKVILNQQTLVIFSGEQDFSKAISSLQQILSKVTIDSEPKTIDLRREKPVVVFD